MNTTQGPTKPSLVFMGLCHGFGDINRPDTSLAEAFVSRGAKVVLGWQGVVESDFDANSAGVFFNNLLTTPRSSLDAYIATSNSGHASEAVGRATAILRYYSATSNLSVGYDNGPRFTLGSTVPPAISGDVPKLQFSPDLYLTDASIPNPVAPLAVSVQSKGSITVTNTGCSAGVPFPHFVSGQNDVARLTENSSPFDWLPNGWNLPVTGGHFVDFDSSTLTPLEPGASATFDFIPKFESVQNLGPANQEFSAIINIYDGTTGHIDLNSSQDSKFQIDVTPNTRNFGGTVTVSPTTVDVHLSTCPHPPDQSFVFTVTNTTDYFVSALEGTPVNGYLVFNGFGVVGAMPGPGTTSDVTITIGGDATSTMFSVTPPDPGSYPWFVGTTWNVNQGVPIKVIGTAVTMNVIAPPPNEICPSTNQ